MDPAEALRTTGFAVFRGLYSQGFIERARDEIERSYVGFDRPALCRSGKTSLDSAHAVLSGSGLLIGQFLSRAPSLAGGYVHPAILATMIEVLGAPIRLETTAATISDEHRNPVLTWHNHIGGLDEDLERAVDYDTLDPERIRRLTLLVYLDELSDEGGPLLVLPRKLADPIACPFPDEDYTADWAGRLVVTGAPGTAVLLEERTWHASLARRTPGFRRFVGAMVAADWAPTAENTDPSAAGFAEHVSCSGVATAGWG